MEDFSALEKFIKLGMIRRSAGVDLTELPEDIPADARWLCEKSIVEAQEWLKNPRGDKRQRMAEYATHCRNSVNSRNLADKRDDGDVMELVGRIRAARRSYSAAQV